MSELTTSQTSLGDASLGHIKNSVLLGRPFELPQPVLTPYYSPVQFTLMEAEGEEFTPKAPLHGSESAGGFDLYVATTQYLAPGQSTLIRTGVMMKIPQGWVGIISPRSSVASKQLLRVGARIIDSDYRGEVLVNIHNDSQHQAEILSGERIAQIVFVPHLGQMVQVDSLDDTVRGAGGFGSTGV